jgi:hypothetical protein
MPSHHDRHDEERKRPIDRDLPPSATPLSDHGTRILYAARTPGRTLTEVSQIIECGCREIVIDCGEAQIAGSGIAATLVDVARRTSAREVHCQVRGLSPRALSWIEIHRLGPVLAAASVIVERA